MFSIHTFIRGWNSFFYGTSDATMLALFRILLGFFLFLNGISLVQDFDYWFGVGSEALVPLRDSLSYYTGFRINLYKLFAPTEAAAWIILTLYIFSSVTVMIGLKTRVSTIACFVLLTSMQSRNHAILNSGDTVLRCMLFVMMFAPSQVKFSLDALRAKKLGIPYSTQVPSLTIRLLQLQFSIVYLATTLFKLKGYDWVDGTAIYYTSRLENFQRLVLPFVFDHLFFVKALTWGALFIEFAMGTLVWVREFRIWVLLAGLVLHLGIEVTMSIGFFEWVMISAYLLFVEPDDLKRLKAALPESFVKLKLIGPR